jgi:lactate dehydrogenase-like 2-hydroxyacid dehydrogenase
MNVYVYDTLWNELLTINHKRQLTSNGASIILNPTNHPQSDNIIRRDASSKIIVANPDNFEWTFKENELQGISNLKCFITGSTGFEWINQNILNELDTALVNIRDFTTEAVTDWYLMSSLCLARKIPELIKQDFPINFTTDYATYRGVNMSSLSVGVVGMGNLGKSIAKKYAGLGLSVSYWSKNSKFDEYNYLELDELFSSRNIIVLTLAENHETLELLSDELFSKLRSSSYVISPMHNVRQHKQLLLKVGDGRLAGYSFEEKNPNSFDKYKGNIWAAPAYAWCTDQTMDNMMDKLVEAICLASRGEYPNRVN